MTTRLWEWTRGNQTEGALATLSSDATQVGPTPPASILSSASARAKTTRGALTTHFSVRELAFQIRVAIVMLSSEVALA
ncbi:MAG: hypothetical protein ACREBG_01235 [Pyrinomonadaceae bacterium]